MFEKWIKKSTNRAADSAIEGVKESLNDKIDKYGDIIQIGLVLSVIIFGGRHLTKKHEPYRSPVEDLPYRLTGGNGQPIIINNYYTRTREEERAYERRQKGKMDQKH